MLILSSLMQTEVNFLGQLRHPHLVKLIGYCCEDDHRLLVYEFMFRGSLENHLFRSMSRFRSLSKQCFSVVSYASMFKLSLYMTGIENFNDILSIVGSHNIF